MMWIYNKKLFEQAKLDPEAPPKTWDELLAACEALKTAGIEPLDAISLGEPQNAEAGAEPLLGMRLRPHDCLE